MGRPPAYVFVVRHGNRLDAADKQWHLTSPAPYDPPLTYGGWLQCRRLGVRIASILQDREAEDEAAAAAAAAEANTTKGQSDGVQQPRKKRRYRIILHSSPFLRCIQTSIAISAGIASTPFSYARPSDDRPWPVKPPRNSQVSSFSNPAPSRSRPTITTDIPSVYPSQTPSHVDKTILRLDPFLGEWASPDYFDHITPPPKSSLMLMTAKAELLRKEDHIVYPQLYTPSYTPSTPSRLWNSPTQARGFGLDSLPSLGETLPGNSSHDHSDHRGHKASFSESAISTGYMAPVPSYAVSTSEPIPQGYVAHARDACVEIDYQWDSTRDPVSWGEGGILPEEWAGMHQRFRKGLKRLVDWYTTSDHPGEMVTRTPTSPNLVKVASNSTEESAIDDDESDIENVVILVSHGAGCNALVGGITNQPVLADVPMASLTMARRRARFDNSPDIIDNYEPASLDDALSRRQVTVQDLYELSMFANTDHMTGSGSVSRSGSLNAGFRGRDSRGSGSALKDINFGAQYGQPRDSRSNSLSTTLGNMRKVSSGQVPAMRSPSLISSGGTQGGITVGSGATSFGTAPRTTSWGGLWTPRQEPVRPEEDPDMPMTLDFSHEKEAKKSPPPETIAEVPELEDGHAPVQPASEHTEHHKKAEATSPTNGSGMWGTPRPPDDAEKLRDFTSQKRRWTVTERQPVVHT